MEGKQAVSLGYFHHCSLFLSFWEFTVSIGHFLHEVIRKEMHVTQTSMFSRVVWR
jgi:hypothetical protein